MANAQTYIIGKEDGKVYVYESDFHDDNHFAHLVDCYNTKDYSGFLPFIFNRDGYCVIDLVKHDILGSMYLPDEITSFQKDWILDRKNYFGKFEWFAKIGTENINHADFNKISDEIQNHIKVKKVK